MTTSALSQTQPSIAPSFIDYFKQNPLLTRVTAIGFAALGICSAVSASVLFASVSLATILAIAAACCLTTSAFFGYFAIQQILSSKNPLSEVENVNGSPPNIALSNIPAQKSYRVQVMNETLSHLKAGFYTSPDGTRHTLNLNASAAGACVMQSTGNTGQRPGTERGSITVKNKDCLYVAAELHAKGLNPLVLDMGSDRHFGGGYLTGARAQEEDCCRRSGLCLAADTRHNVQTRNFYPLNRHSRSAGVYVPLVPIFRAGYDKSYQYLNRPFNAAFGVIAALNSPTLDNSSGSPHLQPADAQTTREKIRTFFEMAHQKGHDSVVFGALGCGAFHNPPEHIAQIAMDVVNNEFKHCFKEIVFAVLDDHNTGTTLNRNGNFAPFARQAIACGGKAFGANDQEITTV